MSKTRLIETPAVYGPWTKMAATAAAAPANEPAADQELQRGVFAGPRCAEQHERGHAGEQRERDIAGQTAATTGHGAVDPVAAVLALVSAVPPPVAEPGTATAAVPTPKEDAPLTGCPSEDTTRQVTT